jgi:hypothetical protein
VFGPVIDQNLSRRAFGGNQIGVLRHIPRLVDFSGVNYLLDDLDFGCRRDGVATHFSSFVVPIEVRITLGQMDRCNLEMILGLTGGVGAK